MLTPGRLRILLWYFGGGVLAVIVMAVAMVLDVDWLAWGSLIAISLCLGLGWLKLQTLLEDAEFDTPAAASAPAQETAGEHFLSVAGHDLRQPIQALSLFAATLSAQPLPDASRKLAAQLEQASQSLSELFEAVIAHAKALAGRYTITVQAMPLADVLGTAVGAQLDLAHDRNLHLRHVDSSLTVRADPVMLSRMLNAMLLHALRSTRRGGVLLGARPRDNMVSIEVWDSSEGLTETLRATATEAFADAWQTLPDRGLGLAQAARLAQDMGGHLEVRSRTGKGTLYRLLLPRT